MDWASFRDNLPGFKEAGQAAELSAGLPSYSGGPQDALRHATWMALMGQKYGRVVPQVAGAGMEALGMIKALGQPRGIPRVAKESVMDFINNETGARFGAENRNLPPEQLVKALRERSLRQENEYDWDTYKDKINP